MLRAMAISLNLDTIPLCVPPWEQREALDEGAKYTENLGFYVPADAYLPNFRAWLPRKYNPYESAPYLLPDMLPVTTWEQNVRNLMGSAAWDRMRRHAYKAAGFRCEICGASGKLEAHEKFVLYNETSVQRLERIMALCPLCHKAHHLGIARRLGMLRDVKAHMLWVNGWTADVLDAEIAEAYEVWEQRCHWPWTVDLSWLQENGYLYV